MSVGAGVLGSGRRDSPYGAFAAGPSRPPKRPVAAQKLANRGLVNASRTNLSISVSGPIIEG
jgi:hypothetical protein